MKNDKWAKGFIMGFFAAVTGILIGLYFSSCQPKDDPLKNAEFSCKIIYKGWNYECKIQCQDSLYHGIYEDYYKKYREGDVIKQPLN